MKFRLTRQRQAHTNFDLRIICPSLHDDPAFSADPHSNPYSVTCHLSPPPLGHPVLKNKITHDTADSDFRLIQPPNSPVIPSGLNPDPQYSLPNNSASPSINQSFASRSDHRSSLPPPPKKESKRMGFLSRRQSAQPQPIKSLFSSIGKNERRRSGLPTFSGDPTLPPRPIQHTKTSAPVIPRIPGHMVQELDQVDELDETNPWGIPIHHDGPYEAVNVQVNKRDGNRVPLGLANNNGLYNIHALGQIYIPPQVPAGVSLNLSPGQILPRHFLVPFIQPASIPNTSSSSGPYILHIPPGPILTPPHEPEYMATFPDVDSGSKIHDDLSPTPESTLHSDLSFNIGMAMLEPADNAPVPSPRVFLPQAELPDEQDFDPYDPTHLESEHRRIPSPPVSAQPEEQSRSQTSQSFQNASFTGTSSNNLDAIQPAGHSRNNSDPPMYNEHPDDEDTSHQTEEQHPPHPSSQTPQTSQISNSLTPQNSVIVVGTGLQQPPLNGSRIGGPSPSDRTIPRAPTVTQDRRVEVTQGTQHILPAQTSPPFPHPRGDGRPSPPNSYGNEPDVQSTHYSTSTHSSNQFQNGGKPPPRRHLPKRLIMPTPLNTGPLSNATASLHIGHIPQSQTFNIQQTHLRPPPFNQHSLLRSPLGNLPMAPIYHHGNTRVEDIPVSRGRKLRKRESMIDTPTPAPVITTVSFAPPIIEFDHNATNEKAMARSTTGKIPKKLVSKRKI